MSLIVPNFPKADLLSSIIALALSSIQAVLKTHGARGKSSSSRRCKYCGTERTKSHAQGGSIRRAAMIGSIIVLYSGVWIT